MNGLLIIDKPSGWTSHDVVNKVRHLSRQKRVGHTGTLDPLATGVLVLCIGKATRIARYLEYADKEYEAVMRLGVMTDTLDADGAVVETRPYAPPSRDAINRAFDLFRGELSQRPPVYSAVKIAGVPSYKLARQGKASPLKERPITIYDLTLLDYQDPFVRFRVRCSKGTYIRTLCSDLGNVLGTGAHLTALRRTHAGNFSLEQASSMEMLITRGNVDGALLSLDRALADLPAVTLSVQEAARISHGNALALESPGEQLLNSERKNSPVTVYDSSGRLVAVARVRDRLLRPEVVMA